MTSPSGTGPVLETKFFIPRWQAGLVTRPRLIDRMREAVRGKLTVVSAPAGAGKTTLLAEWLAQRTNEEPPVGWVSLDAADNEPSTFWTVFIRALQKTEPAVGQQALATLEVEGSATVAALTTLLNEIAGLDCELILVLDDYHTIETAAIHTALAFVLDHLPPRMHIVLATRTDPVLPIARMRARGEVTELRVTDLRFTTDETSIFLNRVMALDLTTSDIAELAKRTEGWIAGLKLAALSMKGHADVPAFIRSFSGDNRYVADYLIEEVLQAQPERTRRFLLATAILERLSASLCDAVAAEDGSQALLEMLEKTNLFVIALDDRREWYRYHHLFAEVLHAHAMRADPAHVRELHRRASVWYEQEGNPSEAVRHALLANDYERVAHLLEQHWPVKDRSYESARWLARVKLLPEDVVRARPQLNMGYAWALLNAGDLEAAETRLLEVAQSMDVQRYPTLPRELATAHVYLAQSRGDVAGTAERARDLIDLVPEGDESARATALALLALAHWANGELDAAHTTFASALAAMRRAGAELDAIRGEFVLGDIRTAQGRLREASRIYEAGIELAAAHTRAEADELYLGLSEVQREWGNLEEATRLLLEIEQAPMHAVHAANRHRWCVVMARVSEARGDLEGALDLLAEAEVSRRRDPLPVARPIPAMIARIRIAQGKLAETERWVNEQGLRADDDLSFLREYDHITFARFLMAGSAEPAVPLLERLHAAAMAGGRTGSAIETLILMALAQNKLGNSRIALDAVANALELAEPDAYLRIFVDEGVPARDLLRQAAARGIAGAYTRRILSAFDDAAQPAAMARPDVTVLPAGLVLTARELEILRLIAAGMRNQEIATQLFISPATVKRHIANIYNKLNARHRTEALKRAGALNLL